MARRDNKAELDNAETIVDRMKDRANSGASIKKADYKTCTKLLKSCTSLTHDFKDKLCKQMASQLAQCLDNDYRLLQTTKQSLRRDLAKKRMRGAPLGMTDPELEDYVRSIAGQKVKLVDGEADLAIVRRAKQLVDTEFVVVGNDCDYAIHPSIPILLRPSGKKYIQYKIDELLAKSEWIRAQFTALGCVSITDYSANLFGLGIVTNSRIIKSFPAYNFVSTEDNAREILKNYYANDNVLAALGKIEPSNKEMTEKQREASKRIFTESQETLLSTEVKDDRAALVNETLKRVMDLKARMLEASRLRRQVLKTRKEKSIHQKVQGKEV